MASPWWVSAIAYPAQPDTAVPFYLQAATQADATAKIGGPPLAGPFTTKAEAVAWATGPGKDQFGKGKTNIAPPQDPGVLTIPKVHVPVPSVPGLSQIGTFFSDLSQASTWIRVAEVLAGLILIAVGVARITHAVPIATKVAKAVGTKGLL